MINKKQIEDVLKSLRRLRNSCRKESKDVKEKHANAKNYSDMAFFSDEMSRLNASENAYDVSLKLVEKLLQ